MKKVILVLTAFIVISVAFLSGCTDTKNVGTYDDEKFHQQCLVPVVTSVFSDADEAIDAYEIEKWERFRFACENLEENTLRLLDEIEEYTVSTTYEIIWSEFKSALEDFKQASSFGKNKGDDDIETAYEYLSSGTNHCNTVLELLKEMEE